MTHDDRELAVNAEVHNIYSVLSNNDIEHVISPEQVHRGIKRLKPNSSPGIDGVASEYFIYGNSDQLCHCISSFFFLINA